MPDDPFATLGLAPTFQVDVASVERAYLSRAAGIHPDVVGDDDEAAIRSAQLNRAKSTILNPEKRANALLAIWGGPSKEQDKALPAGFLMEMMETRETIEEALAGGDQAQRQKWEHWARERRNDYMQRVAALFAAAGPKRDSGTLQSIRQELNAWRYIERLIEQLDPKYNPATRD